VQAKPLITLLHGDCLEKVSTLRDRSIRAVITSPPYVEKRNKDYPSIPEKDFPNWMASVCEAIKPKLTDDGSIFIVIRSHVKNGNVLDYVLQARLAIRNKAKLSEKEELIWYKPEADSKGSYYRPRRSWEHVLWFSACKNPFVNLRAAGRIGTVGYSGSWKTEHYSHLTGGTSKRRQDLTRVRDVFVVPISDNSKHVKHPAMYPPALVEQLVLTFTEEGDTILDPCAGSGTTLFVARTLGRHSVGIEAHPEFVNLIRTRKRSINWQQAPRIDTMPQKVAKIKYLRQTTGVNVGLSIANLWEDQKRWNFLDMAK
jgi:DNA modification methylase